MRFLKKWKIRWGWLLFTGVLFALMVWSLDVFRRDFYVNATGNWYRKRILVYLLPMALNVICSQFRPKIPEKWHALVRAVFVCASITLASLAFQSLCWDTLWYDIGIPMRADCFLLQLSLVAVLFAVIWLLVWDSRRAALTVYALMCLLAYIYRCVYLFRGMIFKVADLLTMDAALAVAGQYTYSIQSEQAFWISCGVLLWMISLWVPRRKIRTRKMKLAKGVVIAAAGIWFAVVLFSPLLPAMNLATTVWPDAAVWNNLEQGVLPTLMKEVQDVASLRPQGYSTETLAGIDVDLQQAELTEGGKPNVIVIMNEAFSDLQSLWQIDTSEDVMPFIHSIRDQSVWGDLYVSSYGGETCNTEHSFLTGANPTPNLPMALLTTVKANTPSIAWQMKAQGYQTTAIHPENRGNYQRDHFYPRLGLDEFLDEEAFENAEYVHGWVSDWSCYEKIISLYEAKDENELLFVFNVTMQNHGLYDRGQVEDRIVLAQPDPDLQEYLNCVSLSAQAFEKLVRYFETQEEPTIILMFGDHQPNIPMEEYEKQPGLSGTAQQFTPYITSFIIWANYPIEARHVESLSVNYLSALLMETAGLPMTQYDEWLLETAKRYPVVNLYGYGDAQGNSAFWDSNEENWPLELQQLNHLRYNRLYDAENRLPALRIPE